MGKWLAEFQENYPVTCKSYTDNTDRSNDVSVLSVSDQGILKEKSLEETLFAHVCEACVGLDMSPEQFMRLLNSQGKEQIVSGEISVSLLKRYAKQVDNAIKNGVVDLITKKTVRIESC